ncbi:radical SAM/SPASM domain-containing protein [Clostridium thailandense]|uniref:radical SAM/SPASM domain-containing protein n=1 Tax=Clostridium thailandense TaxID=2794346 RepID=UPI003989FC2C
MNDNYGFYDRLKEEFPSQIIVDVTEVCNLSCIHCPHERYEKLNILNRNFLDISLNRKLVEEVKKYGNGNTQQIRYTANGEPLVHPKIYEMLKYAADYSETFVSVTTNGTLLNENNVKTLLGTGVKLIDISIDAFYNETYLKIRKNGNLEITRSNVLNLIKLKNDLKLDTKIVVSFVEQELNKDEVKEFQNYWNSNGVDYVIIRKLHSAGGANNYRNVKLNECRQKREPCVYPWERIMLTAKGNLSYCPNCWDGGAKITDYKNTSIYNVWHSEFYENLRKSNISADLRDFSFCNQCGDWAQTTWPNKGRGYGDMINDFNK